MDQEQANAVLDAMARTALATDALFTVIGDRPEVLSDEQIAAVEEYVTAKREFDSLVRGAS